MSGIKTSNKTGRLDQNYLPKEGTFAFRCTECGACCRNVKPEDKVLLSTVDIYRMAKLLEIEVMDFIGTYCDMVPGGESMLPLMIMKDRLDGSCIFLKKGKCSVHDAKPLACAMFPLGRIDIFNEDINEKEFHYYLNEFHCAAEKDQLVTVQEWLDRYHVEEYDQCVRMYKRMGAVCSKIMHELKTDEQRREMFSTTFFMMYAKYDTSQELLPQIMQNLAFMQSINPSIAFDKSKMV